MRVKFSNIILIFALGSFVLPNLTYAQEGQIEDEKTETSEVIRKDSLPTNGELTVEEATQQSDVLPVGPMPEFNFSKIPSSDISKDKDEKKPVIGNDEKVKEEETQSNHSFNFIYYLFYKFKLVEGTDG